MLDKKRKENSKKESLDFLIKLEKLIKTRQEELPQDSYTTELFEGGKNEITKKLGEELVELVMASSENDRDQVIYEVADFLYHLMVFLRLNKIELKEVITELKRRG